MQSLANGTELGAYTIVRLIGRGGMGEVYEAYEHRLQRRVALKVIAPQKAGVHGEVDLVRRFLQEARTLAQINHPNVVTIYAIDAINDTQFIAMEFVDGALFKDIFALFALSADEAAPMFLQLLEGLKCLHDNRILHRDIKPHNLMIRPNGQVKILDFGIAKRLGDRDRENTTVGVVVGTLAYLPPEVLYGQTANQRSDLWSLGAIFYECLVGQPLVSIHSTKVKGIRAASDSDVVFPHESLGWIPLEMRSIIGRLCDRRPEARYGTAGEAIEAIQRFIQKRTPVPHSTFSAFHRAVENIVEIRLHADTKNLTGPKSKREMALTVLGAPAPLEEENIEIEKNEEDGALATELTKDSISARRNAQRRARKRREGWQWPLTMAAAAFVLLGAGLKFWSGHVNHDPLPIVKKADPPGVEAPKLTAPAQHQALWMEPTQIPTMTWSKQLSPGDYELQIANDINFNTVVVREEVTGTYYRPGRILPEGEYYWQLYPLRPQVKPTTPSQFSISFLAPVEVTWPKEEQIYDLPQGAKLQEVNFTWKCKAGAGAYRTQVSADSEFNNLTAEKVVTSCSWSGRKLAAGFYYWRVRVEQPPSAQATWSNVRTLDIRAFSKQVIQTQAPQPLPTPEPVVQKTPTPAPQPLPIAEKLLHAPKLKNPRQAITLQFNGSEGLRDPAAARKSMLEAPAFRWLAVPGARGYNIQIAWNPDFSKLISEETVSSAAYEWRQVVPGRAYWRVRATKESGAPGPFSHAGEVDVRLPEPKTKSDYKIGEKVPLQWEPVPLAEKYIVRWSEDRSLASVSEMITDEPKVVLETEPSTVYMKVAAATSAGDRVSGFSQVSTVTIEAPLRLGAPGIITPPTGARVQVGKSGRISVVFSWTKVDKADSYIVEISSNPEFSKVLQKKAVKSTHWLLKGAKINGKVFWRVRTEGQGGPSAWSTHGSFEVR